MRFRIDDALFRCSLTELIVAGPRSDACEEVSVLDED